MQHIIQLSAKSARSLSRGIKMMAMINRWPSEDQKAEPYIKDMTNLVGSIGYD